MWPEFEAIKSFESGFPNGYSEDSDKNELRKLKKHPKKVTVDGFFYKGKVELKNVKLAHNEPFYLAEAKPWHVSDHFGVTAHVHLK